MLLPRQNVLIILLLSLSFYSFSQENKSLVRYYIKLNPTLNFNTPKAILNIEGLSSLSQEYSFTVTNAYSFTREQVEKFSSLSKSNHTLKNTFLIETSLSEIKAERFLSQLKKIPNLVYAYQSNTTAISPPHDIAPTTSDLEFNQGYIESNPGMNIRYAWDNGFNGAGINIRDIEYGININHEELDHTNAALPPNTTVNSGATLAYTEHGTSVAGIVFADKGSYGVSGIAYGANEYILYPEWTEEYGYNRVLATSNAIANSSVGDVIIYEMQTFGQNGNYVPAEYEQAIWDLTKAATDAGIIIVAAAGNGSENLDDTFYNSYMARGDSGAIIVGAGSSDNNHSPLYYTTYGNRVNVHSWGENVTTIGDSCANTTVFGNDLNQTYNYCFNGTSSATAVTGGFTAVLQSYYFAQTGEHLTSQELRTLMINTGIPQGTGVNIGPLPNMEAAILELDNTLSTSNKMISNFTMFPNPAKGILNIKLNANSSSASLKIINLIGQEVLATQLTQKNTNISLSKLAKGLYLTTIKTNNTVTTKKLIIN